VKQKQASWVEASGQMHDVIAALTRQRDLINNALDSLLALQSSPGAAAERPAAKPTHFTCASHPGSTEFSKNGVCKTCQSERMRKYWDDRRQQSVQDEDESPTRGAIRTFRRRSDAVSTELVYSKQQRCPKCSLTTRFHRPSTATQNGFWTCVETGCELKVSNYKIPVDRVYTGEPEEAAAALQ
jgi:ribosomal protein L37AE/L43A